MPVTATHLDTARLHRKVQICDARAGLRKLPDGCAQAIVTSPPYWQCRAYAARSNRHELGREATLAAYLRRLVAVLDEARRVLHPTGTVWLVIGDGYRHHGRRDPGQRGVSRAAQRRTLVGGAKPSPGVPVKSLLAIPQRLAVALQARSWLLRAELVWAKPAVLPDTARDRPRRTHETILLLTRQQRYWFRAEGSQLPSVWWAPAGGGEPAVGGHPAVLPAALAERMVYLGTPDEGVCARCARPQCGRHRGEARVPALVVDPFFGSGTTGAAAELLGRRWHGIELHRQWHGRWHTKTGQQALPIESSVPPEQAALPGT